MSLWKKVKELIYPGRCPVCDGMLPFGKMICDACRDIPERIGDRYCLKCGKALEAAGREYCTDCGRLSHIYEKGCAVFRYKSVSGPVYRFKYQGRAEYADYFGKEMAGRVKEIFGDPFDMIVPVPASPERVLKRGYDQSVLLAESTAGYLGIPLEKGLLKRRKSTKVLKNMGISGRRKSLNSAFIALGNDVSSKSILLVDDIYTTGSTIDACALELYRKGAASVGFVVLAMGDCYL